MSTSVETVPHGQQAAAGRTRTSKAIEVASGGLRTPRDITNFALAHSIDVLQETVGAKQANASLRGVTVGLRAIEIGQRVGQHHDVAGVRSEGDGGETVPGDAKELARRRMAELSKEMEQLAEVVNA